MENIENIESHDNHFVSVDEYMCFVAIRNVIKTNGQLVIPDWGDEENNDE